MAAPETITISYSELVAGLITTLPPNRNVIKTMPGGNQKFNYGCDSAFTRREITTDDGYCEEKRNGVSYL